MRSLAELLSPESAWPLVQTWIAGARNHVEVLPATESARGDSLQGIQVTTRSPLGAIVYETGGLLIDRGWVRVLGSGHARLPRRIDDWNRGRSLDRSGAKPAFFLVADDVVGGFFAMDGGAFRAREGSVHYLAPDTLGWEATHDSYSDLLRWLLDGDLDRFYRDYRGTAWQQRVSGLSGDRAFSIAPPPFTAGLPLPERSWRAVPIAELYALHFVDPHRGAGA